MTKPLNLNFLAADPGPRTNPTDLELTSQSCRDVCICFEIAGDKLNTTITLFFNESDGQPFDLPLATALNMLAKPSVQKTILEQRGIIETIMLLDAADRKRAELSLEPLSRILPLQVRSLVRHSSGQTLSGAWLK